MYMTSTIPKQHLSSCYLINIITQVIIRTKYQFGILWQLINNLLGITTGHYHISQRLHSCCSVYITDNLIARMLILELLQVFSLTTIS